MAKKPNYSFEKRRKEQEKKMKREEKLLRKRENAVAETEPSSEPDGDVEAGLPPE